MKALLINPSQSRSAGNMSFNALVEERNLAGLKALNPPLGILTMAALLPENWEIRFFDRNVVPESESDWEWADLVMTTGLLDQDMWSVIRQAKSRGKKVVVGGSHANAIPRTMEKSGVDYLVLDEAEETLPRFLEALERGDERGVFRASGLADVSMSPLPRFDLVDLDAYFLATIQFSRGCPYRCEFCDIINLNVGGRKPRTKPSEQVLAELEELYKRGWTRYVYLADDNFVGNRKRVKEFLRDLIPWMKERRYPFPLMTEATINLAEDDELLELLSEAGFNYIFVGIEATDPTTLKRIHKIQNARKPLLESCLKITRAGIQVTAGFILGFDGEPAGAGQEICRLVEEAAIPHAQLNLLMAVPNADLWERLKREGRLLNTFRGRYQGSPMNFLPTRPIPEVTQELIDAWGRLYDPDAYLERCHRQFLMMKPSRRRPGPRWTRKSLRLFWNICVRNGVERPSRWRFWSHLISIGLRRPRYLHDYLMTISLGESLFGLRDWVRDDLQKRLRIFEINPDLLTRVDPEQEPRDDALGAAS